MSEIKEPQIIISEEITHPLDALPHRFALPTERGYSFHNTRADFLFLEVGKAIRITY